VAEPPRVPEPPADGPAGDLSSALGDLSNGHTSLDPTQAQEPSCLGSLPSDQPPAVSVLAPPRPALAGPWARALARPLGDDPHISQVPPEQRFRAGAFFITVAVAVPDGDSPRWVLAVQHKGNMTKHKGRDRHRTKRTPRARERIVVQMQRVATRMIERVGQGNIIGRGQSGDEHGHVVLVRDCTAQEIAWMGKE
jgi:hypothetical protein